jgi:hypothetical protein
MSHYNQERSRPFGTLLPVPCLHVMDLCEPTAKIQPAGMLIPTICIQRTNSLFFMALICYKTYGLRRSIYIGINHSYFFIAAERYGPIGSIEVS